MLLLLSSFCDDNQSIFAVAMASVRLIPLLLRVWFIAYKWLSFRAAFPCNVGTTCLNAFAESAFFAFAFYVFLIESILILLLNAGVILSRSSSTDLSEMSRSIIEDDFSWSWSESRMRLPPDEKILRWS